MQTKWNTPNHLASAGMPGVRCMVCQPVLWGNTLAYGCAAGLHACKGANMPHDALRHSGYLSSQLQLMP